MSVCLVLMMTLSLVVIIGLAADLDRCHEKGLVYSKSTNTCKSPISVICGDDGPTLGVGIAPVLGICKTSNVYGSPAPCAMGCMAGYTITGNPVNYTCGADGQWAGSGSPTCNRKSRSRVVMLVFPQ